MGCSIVSQLSMIKCMTNCEWPSFFLAFLSASAIQRGLSRLCMTMLSRHFEGMVFQKLRSLSKPWHFAREPLMSRIFSEIPPAPTSWSTSLELQVVNTLCCYAMMVRSAPKYTRIWHPRNFTWKILTYCNMYYIFIIQLFLQNNVGSGRIRSPQLCRTETTTTHVVATWQHSNSLVKAVAFGWNLHGQCPLGCTRVISVWEERPKKY